MSKRRLRPTGTPEDCSQTRLLIRKGASHLPILRTSGGMNSKRGRAQISGGNVPRASARLYPFVALTKDQCSQMLKGGQGFYVVSHGPEQRKKQAHIRSVVTNVTPC